MNASKTKGQLHLLLFRQVWALVEAEDQVLHWAHIGRLRSRVLFPLLQSLKTLQRQTQLAKVFESSQRSSKALSSHNMAVPGL